MKFLCPAACLLFFLALGLRAESVAAESLAQAIPFAQLGAEAQKQYTGSGIAITPTAQGARLCSSFQKLEGEATRAGLWLSSTDTANGRAEPFRVLATALGRCSGTPANAASQESLPSTGTVTSTSDAATFARPGLLEEYRVSMDGVRQDFVVLQRPEGAGSLSVTLAVTGAQVTAADYGVKLTLARSGREVGYSRLHVTDAAGRELGASLEVLATDRIAVRVEDAAAIYPVRIDPTFSDADWVSMNPGILGTDGPVYALAVDGSGKLYAGGSFSKAGAATASNIAKWDGTAWSALGTGVSDRVTALAVSGSDLYAGGDFTTAGGGAASYVAKWDGSTWSSLGTGMNAAVTALAVNGGKLYAGGYFLTAGGVSANRIAQWDGSAWSALGTGMNNTVQALAVMGGKLYAGGQFSTGGGVTANAIAKWDGTTWSALGTGIFGTVSALAVSGTTLYVGGSISSGSIRNIGKWDGNAWSSVGIGGVSFTVNAVAVNGTDVYVGSSQSSGTVISRWDGTSWSTPGGTAVTSTHFVVTASISAMVFSGANLYVGGYFTNAGGKTARNLAKWDGGLWTQLQMGFNGPINALAVSGQNLYAGGSFTMAGGVLASNIAKWDGSTWTALGEGMNGNVFALLVNGADVYAGGTFTMAGGVSVNNIAKWDSTVWSALGQGVRSSGYRNVYSMAMIGSNLYAAGNFTVTGNSSANYIARWDGSTWSSLGTGLGGSSVSAYALAVIGTDLYVGGNFTTAGGVSAKNIARWDGTTWNSLASGVPSLVAVMAVSGTRLYAGGSGISVWNGSAWSTIPAGPVIYIYAMTASGTNLYVGGGSGSFANTTKWDGNSWSSQTVGNVSDTMFGGLPAVTSLAMDASNHLYVGGYGFTTVGNGTASPFLAQANLPTPTPDIAVTQASAMSDGTGSVDFGPVVAGSGSAARTFTITNPGDAEISGLSISVDGANLADFAVSTLASTRFVPGDNLTFTVTYTPSALAAGSAALHISSNVSGSKNPFDIALTGTGVTANQGWLQQFFGTTTSVGNAAPGADPNRNGIPNLIEYALGGDPIGAATGTGVLPAATVNAGGNCLQLNFKRWLDRNDVTLTVQAADDPAGPWTDLAQSANGGAFSVITPGASIAEVAIGNPRAVSVTDLFQISDAAHPRRFMRLRASQ